LPFYYKIAIKNIKTFHSKAFQIPQKWDFLFENLPSGNPDRTTFMAEMEIHKTWENVGEGSGGIRRCRGPTPRVDFINLLRS
jgi:hypothetical protein